CELLSDGVRMTPGTSRKASCRSRYEPFSSSSRVTTEIDAGASTMCCSKPEAVTTTVSRVVGAERWAVAAGAALSAASARVNTVGVNKREAGEPGFEMWRVVICSKENINEKQSHFDVDDELLSNQCFGRLR